MNLYGCPEVSESGGRVVVMTPFWQVEQDGASGGAITSILFTGGSGQNVLRRPLQASVDTMGDPLSFMASGNTRDRDPLDACYATVHEASAKVEVSRSAAGFPVVTACGRLCNHRGQPLADVRYTDRSEYHAAYVRKTVTVHCPTPRQDLYALTVAKMVLEPSLTEFACKYSAWQARTGGRLLTASHVFYGRTEPSAYPPYVECYPFRYLALFARGSDAIELIPSGSLAGWENGLSGGPGGGRFGVYTLDASGGVCVLMEPYRELTAGYLDPGYRRPQLQGDFTFSYTIGLPLLHKQGAANVRHTGFGNHPWPDAETIRGWAEKGVNAARLHNDFHDSGDFWHDGTFPPYDPAGMAAMAEVIATAHHHGIRVIPYFSLAELHPQAEAWQQHHAEWKRTVDAAGTEMHNYWKSGEYGSQMCLASGWNDYLQGYIRKVVETYGFDGVYFDWASPLFCNNPQHGDDLHVTYDQVLEFLEWTRGFLGPDRLMVIHTSGSPFMAAESYADATIVFEEVYAAPALLTDVPLVDHFQPQMDMGNCLQRLVCPSILFSKDDLAARKFAANCMAAGLLSYLGGSLGENHPIVENFRRLRTVKLDEHVILPAGRAPVRFNNPALRACIMHNAAEMLVIPVNVASAEPQSGRVWFDPAVIQPAWSGKTTLTCRAEDGSLRTLDCAKLREEGVEVSLDGYAYEIWRLS